MVQVLRGVWLPPPGARAWGLWINFQHEALSLLFCGIGIAMLLGAIRYSRWSNRLIARLRARRP